jgi:asparagine synthase (glutamine-hydrolysing)
MTIAGFLGQGSDAAIEAQIELVARRASSGSESARLKSSEAVHAYCSAPAVHSANGVIAAVQGRPVFAGDVPASRRSHAAALLDAYRSRGVDCLSAVQGSFAVAIVDLNARRIILAIDRMGIERLAFSTAAAGVAFGSSAEQVAQLSGRVEIRAQALYDFLMMHMIPAPDTIYAGVHKLRPGTMLLMENGRVEIRRHWTPRFVERGGESFATLRDELHASLEAAVRACAPDDAAGSFLSGGLDSSTVSGMLSKVSPSPARTFSIGFGVSEYDESRYAQIANAHFGCRPLQYDVTPDDVVTAFPLIAQAYDEPFGNSSAVPTYFCALRAREQNVTHLLAGDGGDEIFGGNERYARHKVFDFYFDLPAFARESLLEPLAPRLPGEGGFKPLAKLRSYIEQARIPLPERLESWNFVYREGRDMLDPQFLASIDPRAPFRTMEEVYASAPCESTLNKMLFYDWHFTLADSDLRKVNAMCALAGVEVSYPMLDQRVVDLANRVPPRQKMQGLELRSFYKRAMCEFLPQEILRKKKHGFGLPFGDWLKADQRLADLIYSHLTDLKKRDIVKVGFLDQLVQNQREGAAMYYGYAIWDLAMLEAWLQAHTGSAARSLPVTS